MSELRLSDVRYDIADRTLLDAIDLVFESGHMTALSGPSGSGKTTLLSIAGGLVEPTSGATSYAGAPMWRGTGDPRPEVAFVLQVYGLVPILSARENVSVALRARGASPADADEHAEAALARFHIADLGDRQVEELSGGQMQRVALARGLCVRSGVLLADEPTSELDEGNRALVLRELRREADAGAVVVVATHDPAVVDACDRHYVLDEGRLVDHVAPVDPAVVSVLYAHPERRVLEEARPPHLEPVGAGSQGSERGDTLQRGPGADARTGAVTGPVTGPGGPLTDTLVADDPGRHAAAPAAAPVAPASPASTSPAPPSPASTSPPSTATVRPGPLAAVPPPVNPFVPVSTGRADDPAEGTEPEGPVPTLGRHSAASDGDGGGDAEDLPPGDRDAAFRRPGP